MYRCEMIYNITRNQRISDYEQIVKLHQKPFFCFKSQFFPKFRVCDGNQRLNPLAYGLSTQFCNAVFGYDIIDIVFGCGFQMKP